MAKLRLKGNKLLIKKLEKMSQETEEKVKGRVEQTLNKIRNGAIKNLNSNGAVDTGFLKNSIAVGLNRESKGMGGVVVANAHYAPYIEFGTGTKVDVPNGLEEYARQFKGKGIRQVNLPARPFLYPAYFKERMQFIKNIKKDINQIIK